VATTRRTPRRFGKIKPLPSGRYQASYIGPDAARHKGPRTFDEDTDAEAWLAEVRRAIRNGTWSQARPAADDDQAPTFGLYAVRWLDAREVGGRPLRPRTVEHYTKLLDSFILPTFTAHRLDEIRPADVREWWTTLRRDPNGPKEQPGKTGPTYRAHAYGLLRAVLATAAGDGLIGSNPCAIKGAGEVHRASRTTIPTLDELDALVKAMPEHLRALVLLAAWCGLRFGEATELRRADLTLDPDDDPPSGTVHVSRAVTHVTGAFVVGDPKSDAGVRDVTVPPHVVPDLAEHLHKHTQPGPRGLLFHGARNGEHLAQSTMTRAFYAARESIGRPDLRFHDLRHLGLTLAAQTGATLAELMERAGHSTSRAALRYQHSTNVRHLRIAAGLSDLAAERTKEKGA